MNTVRPAISDTIRPAVPVVDQLLGNEEAAVVLLSSYDFTTWKQSGVYGMTNVTQDSFENKATAGLAKDIGAELGKSYKVTVSLTRGSGALRLYLSEDGTITTNSDVHELSNGTNVLTVVATGPWLTFRASVGNTTTTVTDLRVEEL